MLSGRFAWRPALHPIAPTRRLLFTVLVLVLPAVLVGLTVGVAVGWWWVGLLVGVVLGAVVAAHQWSRAPDTVIRSLDVVPPDPQRDARLLNLAESLGVAVGVPVPELLVSSDPSVNAVVAGRSPREARIVVTRGLLDRLDRVELEGALAWCFARVRDPALAADTFTVAAIGPWRARLGASSLGRLEPAPGLAATTDRAAVAITRYPPGLLGALTRAREAGSEVTGVVASTGPLWLCDPTGSSPAADAALELRLEVLREL